MDRPSTSTLLTITGITVIGGFLAYAVYFDSKRRNDPAFRRKLRKEKKQVEEVSLKEKEEQQKQQSSGGLSGVPPEVLQLVFEQARAVPLPQSAEDRQNYFMGLIGQGDQMAAGGPQNYLDAAILFYQALRVYPAPLEMLQLYKQQVPEPVMNIIAELYNLDILERIQGYYKTFPPKQMNVSVEQNEVKNAKGGQSRVYSLVSTKGFKSGEEIYVETPVIAALDSDIQLNGTHCSYCLRHIMKGMAIALESDLLKAVYCSKVCQLRARVQYHNVLCGTESALPAEIEGGLPPLSKEDSEKIQRNLVERWSTTGSGNLLLVARLVVMQILAELAKVIPSAGSIKKDLPEFAVDPDRTLYDHMERLRYLEVSPPDGEWKVLKDLVQLKFQFVEDAYTDERHAIFKGKMAYNAIGVCFGGGRNDKPTPTDVKSIELTRTPYGTSKQIGCGLYFVSSYLAHSCQPNTRPSFSAGTSELHLLATRDIQPGEELTMAYVDVSLKDDESTDDCRKRRRAEIAQGWKFACTCKRCEREATADSEEEISLVNYDESKAERVPGNPFAGAKRDEVD